MVGSRFDRTTCHVPVKHTPSNPDDSAAVLHDVDLAIADPVSQRPRPDSQIRGGLDDGEEFVFRHWRRFQNLPIQSWPFAHSRQTCARAGGVKTVSPEGRSVATSLDADEHARTIVMGERLSQL